MLSAAMTQPQGHDLPNDRVIAVINSKGGVGKTTVSTNLAAVLARNGAKVLVVDVDPQGNVGEDYGFSNSAIDDGGQALSIALSYPGHELTISHDVRPNLDVVVGGEHLEMAANNLVHMMSRTPAAAKTTLLRLLAPHLDAYDFIIIDCPPGYPPLQQAALVAARWFLLPVKSDKASRKGLRDVAARLDAVIDVNPRLDMLGVLLYGVNRGAPKVMREAREKLVDDFDGDESRVLQTTIRHAEKAAVQARELGKPFVELEDDLKSGPAWWQRRRGLETAEADTAASSAGLAEDFVSLGREVVERITAAEASASKEERA